MLQVITLLTHGNSLTVTRFIFHIFTFAEGGEILYDRMGTKITMPKSISSEYSAPKPNEFVQTKKTTVDNQTLVPKVKTVDRTHWLL